MNLTICTNCAASQPSLEPICPNCGCDRVHQLGDLAAGETVYACGGCQGLLRLDPASNLRRHPRQYATDIGGRYQLHLPLETANTIFLCQACKRWNWIALDDRISMLRISCPDCLRTTHLGSLGRKLTPGQFLKPVLLGDLRQQSAQLPLKCGHRLYLPRLLFETPMPASLAWNREPSPRKNTQSSKLDPL